MTFHHSENGVMFCETFFQVFSKESLEKVMELIIEVPPNSLIGCFWTGHPRFFKNNDLQGIEVNEWDTLGWQPK